MVKIAAISAMDENRVIGVNNAIPWHYSQDMRHFANLTIGHTVLMGRKTYESLPEKFRPLPKRKNVVAGLSEMHFDGVQICRNLEKYLNAVKTGTESIVGDILWVIGGAKIYQLTMPFWDELYLTLIPNKHQGDAFFPRFEDRFSLIEKENIKEGLTFLRYVRNG